MKKLILLLVFIAPFVLFAQSTSIDPNFIQFPRLSAAPACAAVDKGKQYFNTTDNKMYFCNGSAWVNAFALPYSGSGIFNTIGQAGLIEFSNTGIGNCLFVTAGTGQLSAGQRFAGYFESSDNGLFATGGVGNLAIKTAGGLQFKNNNEGEGKVLVSDATGIATWQGVNTAFMAYQTVNSTGITNGLEGSLAAVTEVFDEGNDLTSGVFKAPKDGIYHFDAGVKWGTNNSTSNFSQATIKKCDGSGNNCVIMASSKLNNQLASQHSLGVAIKLVTNETVKVFVTQTNSDTNTRILEGQDGSGNRPTYFSGYLVR